MATWVPMASLTFDPLTDETKTGDVVAAPRGPSPTSYLELVDRETLDRLQLDPLFRAAVPYSATFKMVSGRGLDPATVVFFPEACGAPGTPIALVSPKQNFGDYHEETQL